ncbi:hypothetical protein D4764_02G0005650 [Takifugu flavidus]|uniref:Uncharacterized protein n=1 Tax=Takifugu flavidus TaxID=433684 RepID=A0A5C6NJ93_9TELE|nr:hypothetical protein D4764_02G0005650 [Takifugu flavidus]
MASSLAVDESSDIRGDSSLNVTEEFLALRPVHGTTTGQDLYEEVSRCGNEMELPREKLVGWTTDGAPAMCGHRSGLVAKIREKMQEENEEHRPQPSHKNHKSYHSFLLFHIEPQPYSTPLNKTFQPYYTNIRPSITTRSS